MLTLEIDLSDEMLPLFEVMKEGFADNNKSQIKNSLSASIGVVLPFISEKFPGNSTLTLTDLNKLSVRNATLLHSQMTTSTSSSMFGMRYNELADIFIKEIEFAIEHNLPPDIDRWPDELKVLFKLSL